MSLENASDLDVDFNEAVSTWNRYRPGLTGTDARKQPAKQFNFTPIADLIRQHPGTRKWWIRDYVPAASVILIYGDPACGKTTIAVDIGGNIASATDWRGIHAKGGKILYVAAEDFYGARLRIEAWFGHRKIPADNVDILDAPIVIADEADVDALIAHIKALPEPPAVLVVDTLALSMGKFSENSDMQLFCNGATKIKRETEITVIVIHHCGHGDKGRSRGGSQLPANADAIFAVERFGDTCTMRCQKMKNGKEPPPLSWRMECQDTNWLDEDGDPISSVVLVPVGTEPENRNLGLGDNQRIALETLKRLQDEHEEALTKSGIDGTARVSVKDWNAAMRKDGLPKNRCFDVKEGLLKRNLIVKDGDCYVRLA